MQGASPSDNAPPLAAISACETPPSVKATPSRRSHVRHREQRIATTAGPTQRQPQHQGAAGKFDRAPAHQPG
jgi:hypothetical protein